MNNLFENWLKENPWAYSWSGTTYNFLEWVKSQANTTEKDAIENIDIGGPTMIRAGAKNFASVTVIVDPKDYEMIVQKPQRHQPVDVCGLDIHLHARHGYWRPSQGCGSLKNPQQLITQKPMLPFPLF